MKKKGFTLIELLAVIVILGVIAVIIVPNITKIIEDNRKDTFEESAYQLINVAKQYFQEHSGEEKFKGKIFSFDESNDLDFEGKKPTGGTLTVSATGDVELYVTDGKYCAIKEVSSSRVTIMNMKDITKCGGDMNAPVVESFVVDKDSIHSDNFSVLSSCRDETGIFEYQYLIYEDGATVAEDSATWISSKKELYTFKSLKPNTKYRLKMRCQNNNGITSYAKDALIVTTGEVEVGCSISPTGDGWTNEKKVTLTYSKDSKYTKQYSRDNGKTWRTVDDTTTELKFTSPGSVIARIVDGTKKQTEMCTVNNVDATPPSTSSAIIEKNGVAQTITVGAYCNDPESGIAKYDYAISTDPIPVTSTSELAKLWVSSSSNAYKFSNLEIGKTYYIYVRCTNNAAGSKVADMIETQLDDQDQPICEITPSGYTNTGKKLTLTYPKGYTNEYRVGTNDKQNIATNNGKEIQNNIWYTTTNLTEELFLKEPSDVYAKITDKQGNKQQVICNINAIDKIPPTLTVTSNPKPGQWYNQNKDIIIDKEDTGGSGLKSYYISLNSANPQISSTCKANDQDDEWICDSASTITLKRGLDKVPTQGPKTYYLWVLDHAGNISTRKEIVIDYIETTKPTCTLKITSGTNGDNGWYRSNVAVEIVTTDAKGKNDYYGPSGIQSYGIYTNQTGVEPSPEYSSTSKSLTITKEGTNYIYGFVKDKAGNVNKCGALIVKKDTVGPTCAIGAQKVTKDSANSVLDSYSLGTWTNTFVKVKATGNDATSLVRKIEFLPSGAQGTKSTIFDNRNSKEKTESFLVNAEGTSNVTSKITDYAGNTTTCSVVANVKEDHTKPVCNVEITSGKMGANNWYIGDVALHLKSKSDALSGVNSYGVGVLENYNNNLDYIYNQNSETNGTIVSGFVKDNAGNTNSCGINIKRDATTPTVSVKSGHISLNSGSDYAFSNNINATFGPSGGKITCNPENNKTTGSGDVSVTCTATSNAGLTSTSVSFSVSHSYPPTWVTENYACNPHEVCTNHEYTCGHCIGGYCCDSSPCWGYCCHGSTCEWECTSHGTGWDTCQRSVPTCPRGGSYNGGTGLCEF